MAEHILEVKNLHTSFHTDAGVVQAVRGVSFYVEKGESLGIVGESGCGKSVSMLSIMRLLEDNASLEADSLTFDGQDLLHISGKDMRAIQGNRIGMIFQSFNLVYRLSVFQNVLHGRLGYLSTPDAILGRYSEQDKAKALELLNTVAEKGNPYAQYLLGKIYYWGNGVEQDRENGLEYIRQAAEQGHPGAVRFLERLSQGEQDAYAASLFPMATRLLRQVGQIFANQFSLDTPITRLVDKKLRQKIAEKKLTHGQKFSM